MFVVVLPLITTIAIASILNSMCTYWTCISVDHGLFPHVQWILMHVYLWEFPLFALYSLLLLSFFLYLKMVLYARDCSCMMHMVPACRERTGATRTCRTRSWTCPHWNTTVGAYNAIGIVYMYNVNRRGTMSWFRPVHNHIMIQLTSYCIWKLYGTITHACTCHNVLHKNNIILGTGRGKICWWRWRKTTRMQSSTRSVYIACFSVCLSVCLSGRQ